MVTAHLLAELLKVASVKQMISWTAGPKQYPTIPFGKHRGLAWTQAPGDYLKWMVAQADMDQDAILCAKKELQRRRGGAKR